MGKYLLIIFLGFGLLIFLLFLPPDPFKKEAVIFKIEKGQNLRNITFNLEKSELIRWPTVFRFYIASRGAARKIQAGPYEISRTMSIFQIANKFINGDIMKITVTIPEGFTQKQIEERLGLKLPGENLEGYLFPDTYHLPADITGEEVTKIMLDNFSKKTAGLKITPEIVTMASILEKEVRSKEDKELVSGILWKRLRVGMPLQVDVEMWTYKNKGLPPAPIANPGMESIIAVLHPKESPYWYYLSTSEGKTIFSKSLEEHNVAKARYLTK